MVKSMNINVNSAFSTSPLTSHPPTFIMSPLTWSHVLTEVSSLDPWPDQLQSALRRVLLKNQKGFPSLGQRSTKANLANEQEWYKNTSFFLLSRKKWDTDINEAVDQSELNSSQKRTIRSTLKRFPEHLGTLGYLQPDPLVKDQDSPSPRLNRKNPPLVVDCTGWKESKPKAKKGHKIALSSNSKDYLKDYSRKYPDLSDEQLLQIIEANLQRIKDEFQKYKIYCLKRGIEEISVDGNTRYLKRLLGYCYETNCDLENLSLETLIPIVDIDVDMDNFDNMDKYYIEQGKANARSKKTAKQAINLLDNFFDDYGQHLGHDGKVSYCKAEISLAKYHYRNHIDIFSSDDYHNIPVISALKKYRKKIPKDPPTDKTLPLILEQGTTNFGGTKAAC